MGQFGGDLVAVLQEFLGHRPAFLLPHRLEAAKRFRQHPLENRPLVGVEGDASRLGDHAGQRQHLGQQAVARLQSQLVSEGPQLGQVAAQRGGVDAVILRRALPVAADEDLHSPAADGAADDLLELRL